MRKQPDVTMHAETMANATAAAAACSMTDIELDEGVGVCVICDATFQDTRWTLLLISGIKNVLSNRVVLHIDLAIHDVV